MKASKITALAFFEELTSKYARRWFFCSFLTLVLVCLLVVYAINGLTKDVFVSVLIEIMAGSLIILAFYVVYVYFIGTNPGVGEVSVVRPQDIGEKNESPAAGRPILHVLGPVGFLLPGIPAS